MLQTPKSVVIVTVVVVRLRVCKLCASVTISVPQKASHPSFPSSHPIHFPLPTHTQVTSITDADVKHLGWIIRTWTVNYLQEKTDGLFVNSEKWITAAVPKEVWEESDVGTSQSTLSWLELTPLINSSLRRNYHS